MFINKKSIGSTFLLVVFGFSAFASEDVQIIDAPSSNSTTVYRYSSAHNRMAKRFSVTYTAFGVGPSYSSAGVGVNLGVYLTRNSVIDFEGTSGRPLYANWFGSDYDIKTSSVGVHFKQFVANSFYFRIGADYRKVDYRHTVRSLFDNDLLTENTFKGDSMTGTILIGNQWQWENFTLGCDWYGYAFPFSSHIQSEKVAGSSPDTSYLKEDEEKFTQNASALGLRFYLGATF